MRKLDNSRLIDNAQKLRREMTKEERHLWYDFLKQLPITVNRQKTISPYIVDFFCAQARLVIELDGGQHGSVENRRKDHARDEYLRGLGLTVVRYTNDQINRNFSGVCRDILNYIDKATPPV